MKTLDAPHLKRLIRGIVHTEAAERSVVTGAFGYTGKYITRELLSRGQNVTTLTGHPDARNPFGDEVSVAPFRFDRPHEMAKSLKGVEVLYNTYWVRFPRGQASFDKAVENTRILIKAAEQAGVRRIVHISVTNASEGSSLPYFRGKALVEKAIMASNLSYAIIRPTVVFGSGDILINNIAWFLRRFPVFAVPGSGKYKIRPIFAEDVARIAVNAADRDDNVIVDAVGPEIYTFNEMVELIAARICSRAKVVHLPPPLALSLSSTIGRAVRDVVLTREEVEGLMTNLLVTDGPSTGYTRLSDWLGQNADVVGTSYASELKRHYR